MKTYTIPMNLETADYLCAKLSELVSEQLVKLAEAKDNNEENVIYNTIDEIYKTRRQLEQLIKEHEDGRI